MMSRLFINPFRRKSSAFSGSCRPSPPGSPLQSAPRRSRWRLGFRLTASLLGLLGLGYLGLCLYLHLNQRTLLYQPRREMLRLPTIAELRMPYEELLIPIKPWSNLHAWWVPALPATPAATKTPRALSEEPVGVVRSVTGAPRVVLFLPGRSGNKSSMGYLRRVQALRQLGFDTLIIDYRGFGPSSPGWPNDWPSEITFYEDAAVAWRYLVEERGIAPQDILIYGESLGGAVAIDLASQQPEAGGLVVQSSFTRMAEVVRQSPQSPSWFQWLPVDWILQEEFDSLRKVRSLQVPVLFIHGKADPVVPYTMSERLYAAAPEPKALHVIPEGTHSEIYRSGPESYVGAIARFFGGSLCPFGMEHSKAAQSCSKG